LRHRETIRGEVNRGWYCKTSLKHNDVGHLRKF
jgi:hypothetical protein